MMLDPWRAAMDTRIASNSDIALAPQSALRISGYLAALALFCVDPTPAEAQGGMQPGEAFVTRFSGVTATAGAPGQPPVVAINVNGTVGSIIDVRGPAFPPIGLHWMTEPQRNAV